MRCSLDASSAGNAAAGQAASGADGAPSLAEAPRAGEHTEVEVWSSGPSGSFFDDDNVI
jgi:hypothetical protein